MAAAIVSVGAAEIGLRLWFGAPQPFVVPQVRHGLTSWGYKTLPNQYSYTGNKPVRTNSWGYRDDEWPQAKRPGVPRVLAIGDSFTFGYLVDQSATFTSLLSAAFRRHGLEWLTAAVGGWNTIEERNFLQAEGMTLKPDLVVLFFFFNDYDAEAQIRPMMLSEDGRLESRPEFLRWLSYDAIYLLKRSALVRLIRERLEGILHADDHRRRFNSLLVEDGVSLDRDERVMQTYLFLADMRRLARQGGADFMVVFCPSIELARKKGPPPRFIGHLGRQVRSLDALFVDATPQFQAAADHDRLFMSPWDNHYSPDGHTLLAKTVTPAIEDWQAKRIARTKAVRRGELVQSGRGLGRHSP